MPALHGRLLVESVLRPFGEHLAAMVDARPGDTCVDVGGDGGVMASRLARTVGDDGCCVVVDDSADVLRDVREQAAMLHHGNVRCVRGCADALPLKSGSAAVVTSLFALPHARDPVAALGELLRVGGRLACAMWSEADAVPHEDALLAALREVTGAPPHAVERALRFGAPLAAEHLVEQTGDAEQTHVVRIHDVVRFDGIAHYWAAMVTERPTAAGIGALPGDTMSHLRDTVEARLRAYTAADGSMRIPAEAVVIVRNC